MKTLFVLLFLLTSLGIAQPLYVTSYAEQNPYGTRIDGAIDLYGKWPEGLRVGSSVIAVAPIDAHWAIQWNTRGGGVDPLEGATDVERLVFNSIFPELEAGRYFIMVGIWLWWSPFQWFPPVPWAWFGEVDIP